MSFSLTNSLSSSNAVFGVFAKNLETQSVLAFHEHDIFPSASLIKVPILVELYRRVENFRLHLGEVLVMRQEDQVGGSGILKDLTPDTKYSLRDLAMLMITVSDNTATNLLIDYLGIDNINQGIYDLGLTHTELVRKLQRIPIERSTVNHTTAYDMSLLMEKIARGQVISHISCQAIVSILLRCQAPVSIAPAAPSPSFIGECESIRVAHKTGSLSDACHDSGIVYTPHKTYVATVLSQKADYAVLFDKLKDIAPELFAV